MILQIGADWIDPGFSPVLTGAILLAGIGTTVLCLVSISAYLQRRSTRLLLVVIALAALVMRTIIGLGTMFGIVPMTVHHLVSHSLDFFIAIVILYGVYRSGPGVEAFPTD